MRVRLDYDSAGGGKAGNRFYLSYAGAAPTAANCATLASDIATAWSSNLASLISSSFALKEVDVLDIASLTGLSGNWTGSENGTDGSTVIPANVATNIEYNIARRYRGGKPRLFLPSPGSDAMANQDQWSTTFVTNCNTGVSAFFAAIAALSIGAVGTLAHVNLSYYTGFKNITNSSGRERAVPQYRAAALVDSISGYSTKGVISSQRRRRTATTY